MNPREHVRPELENIKRKANLMQYCHGRLAESKRKYEDGIVIATSLLAGAASFLLAADPLKIQWTGLTTPKLFGIASIASGAVFILSVIHRQSEWGVQSGKHSAAVDQYSQFLRRLHFYIGSQLEILPEEQVAKDAKAYIDDYARIGETLPKIPSDRFLRLKQEHLQTVALSKGLDKEPFVPIEKLRARLQGK